MPRPDYVGMLEAERDRLREALEQLEPKMEAASRGKPDDFIADWLRVVREALAGPKEGEDA